MKRHAFIIIILALCISDLCHAKQLWANAIGQNRINVSTNVRVGDSWGEHWNNRNYKILSTISENSFVVTLYLRNDEAWNYFCKIKIDNFIIPPMKEIRKHIKNNQWYNYDCQVEFFYNVEYPSIEECFANYGGFVVNSKDPNAKKRVVEAKVTLNPHFFYAGTQQYPNMCLNLWIDNIAFAISYNSNIYFKLK